MRDDEIEHGDAAKKLGAAELPEPLRIGMRAMSKVMTSTAYHL
jgi:ubiquinone biosynthesis monooxygenase Coq7